MGEARQRSSFANLSSVHYLLVKHNDKGAAIPIVVIYFLLFILMTVAFLRLVYITVFDPPYVPLGPAALRNHERYNRSGNARLEENGISMGEYDPGNKSGGVSPRGAGFNNDLDSPGLELFYTKDAFVSEMDGRPVWCSQCCNWYLFPDCYSCLIPHETFKICRRPHLLGAEHDQLILSKEA
jgi:palmitoyltransferase